MLGTSVGKYRIVGELGRGATGIVYRAVDDSLGREVAVKILDPGLADFRILQRFRAEATVLASLNHPGIATIYDLVRSETELLMVMELVRGETLERLSDRLGPLAPERAAFLVDRILSALEHAHCAGVVHRDMKPANVMVTELGRVKIMDFSVARARSAEHTTADGYIVGTPAYMAPEQVLGQGVDERADLYSVGVVFYRLLTGALPFNADTPIGILQQQISEPAPPLRLHRDDLPRWCQAVVDCALAKSPSDRFQSAGAFREALALAAGIVSRTNLAVGLLSGEAARASAATMAPRKRYSGGPAAILGGFAATVAALVYIPFQYATPAHAIAAPVSVRTSRAVAFEGKVLVRKGRTHRERDARLVFSERQFTVTGNGERPDQLHSVPYNSVISIAYSRGRAPMVNSSKGPALATLSQDGALPLKGTTARGHWVAVRPTPDSRLVVLRFENAQIGKVLSALQERTGRTAEVIPNAAGITSPPVRPAGTAERRQRKDRDAAARWGGT
jgi:Protein kinase domain